MRRSSRLAPQTFWGRIVAAHGRRYRVELDDGRSIDCVTRGKRAGAACGDRVELVLTATAEGVIEAIAPRTSLLYRADPYREKLIAANVTQVVIVVAAVPAFHEELLNRCLVAAEAAGVRVLIVLNKIDLPQTVALKARLAAYSALGYEVLAVCAKQDVSAVRIHLAHHTSVLVGQSGMGKSTLVNALLPEAHAKEGEVSVALDSGRHTTTHATLYHLDADSHIIDSPGMQTFGLHHLTVNQIANGFPEFRPHLGRCRFHNCLHLSEPGCALAAALEAGAIDPARLACYRVLAAERLRAPTAY